VSGSDGRQTILVEPGHQMGNGIPTLATGSPGGTLVAVPITDEEQEGRTGDFNGRGGLGTAEGNEFRPFSGSQLAERVLLAARHWDPSRRSLPLYPTAKGHG
jgi:hypothetical protein